MIGFRKDIAVFFLTIALVFGLLSLVLWTTPRYGCNWLEKCEAPLPNQIKFEYLLLLGSVVSIIMVPVMILFARNRRVQNGPFSPFGKVALIWPVITCIPLFLFFFWGAMFAIGGIGIAAVAVIVSFWRKIKSADSKFCWGDLLTVAIAMAWSFVAYFYTLKFWELFGD
jgi:hypothetical protein